MFKVILRTDTDGFKMVKTKRNLKSPLRKNPLAIARPVISRVRSVSTPTTVTNVAGSSIKVIVRVRPANGKETEDNQRIVIRVVDDQLLIFDPKEDTEAFFYHGVQQRGRDLLKKANKNLQFIFDRVFGFTASNYDVFENSTKALITSLMDGYNCSVFVYGATGAGKTHTMLGSTDNPGITFLTMHELFRKKDELVCDRDFDLGVTFLEVYNETVQDLLNPGTLLQLREDAKYGVMVSGTQVIRIESPDELFGLLNKGNKNRTQHPTDSNAESSRSHAVFQVFLRMTMRTTGEVRVAKLSMIDLAGSERGAATGCAGARFTEGANINKSLLALGNCINSLADGHRHVPYRDSKLTRLLKDSLGGNCQTIMIANISPCSFSYEDTYNTLKYATRAKKIKSHMKKNVVNCEMHIGQYVKLVEELNKEIDRLKVLLEEAQADKEKSESKSQVAAQQVEIQAENECDDKKLQSELKSLYNERKVLVERLFNLKNTDQILEKRIELKEDADSRLSGLCLNTPQKEDERRRLGNTVHRLQRQNGEIKSEIIALENQIAELKQKATNIVEKGLSPSLQSLVELEDAKLAQLESEQKAHLYEKIINLQETELKSRGTTLSRMSQILKPCFLQAKGHGFVSESVVKEYADMVRELQGLRSVTWKEDIMDSGLSATSSAMSTAVSSNEEEGRAAKRKADELSSCTSLDSTFVKSSERCNAMNICAEQLMAKVYKPPPTKRVASVKSVAASPRNKENNVPSRRMIGTMGTAQRFPSACGDKNNRLRKPIKTISNRPITPSKAGGDLQKLSLKWRQ